MMSPVLAQPLELGAGFGIISSKCTFFCWKSLYMTFFFGQYLVELLLFTDIVMHSATKFVSGHSDVMAGVLAVKDERLYMIGIFACYGYYLNLSVSTLISAK